MRITSTGVSGGLIKSPSRWKDLAVVMRGMGKGRVAPGRSSSISRICREPHHILSGLGGRSIEASTSKI